MVTTGSPTGAGDPALGSGFTNSVHHAILKPYRIVYIIRSQAAGKGNVNDETGISALKSLALTILAAFEEAETQLVGKAVILTDGTAGTVEAIWLDDFHGLRLSIKGHPGKRPVSTVKFAQS